MKNNITLREFCNRYRNGEFSAKIMQNVIQKRNRVERLREKYPEETRVKLLQMDDPQSPPVGTLGTITKVDDAGNIHVNWDTGSSLALIEGVDRFVRYDTPEQAAEV